MKKITFIAYGIVSQAAFSGTYCYAVGFVANLFVPASLDGKKDQPFLQSILINSGMLLRFALHYCITTTPVLKKSWARFILDPIRRRKPVYYEETTPRLISFFEVTK